MSGGYIADASTANSATLVTPVSVTLPNDTDGAADVYVRVMTTNAPSFDELIGIDNINITAEDDGGGPTPLEAVSPGNKTADQDVAITPFTMAATGGTSPYTWSADGLPEGISINPTTGEVSGTPTTAGASSRSPRPSPTRRRRPTT